MIHSNPPSFKPPIISKLKHSLGLPENTQFDNVTRPIIEEMVLILIQTTRQMECLGLLDLSKKNIKSNPDQIKNDILNSILNTLNIDASGCASLQQESNIISTLYRFFDHQKIIDGYAKLELFFSSTQVMFNSLPHDKIKLDVQTLFFNIFGANSFLWSECLKDSRFPKNKHPSQSINLDINTLNNEQKKDFISCWLNHLKHSATWLSNEELLALATLNDMPVSLKFKINGQDYSIENLAVEPKNTILFYDGFYQSNTVQYPKNSYSGWYSLLKLNGSLDERSFEKKRNQFIDNALLALNTMDKTNPHINRLIDKLVHFQINRAEELALKTKLNHFISC